MEYSFIARLKACCLHIFLRCLVILAINVLSLQPIVYDNPLKRRSRSTWTTRSSSIKARMARPNLMSSWKEILCGWHKLKWVNSSRRIELLSTDISAISIKAENWRKKQSVQKTHKFVSKVSQTHHVRRTRTSPTPPRYSSRCRNWKGTKQREVRVEKCSLNLASADMVEKV